MDITRRQSIAVGGSITAGALGIFGFRSIGNGRNDFEHRYTTTEVSKPVVESGPTLQSGPPYYAVVIGSSEDAKRFYPERLPETTREDWQDIDFSNKFVACFISRYAVTANGAAQGDQPRSMIDGDTFQFVLTATEEETSFEYQENLYTILEKWDKDRAPKKATVVLNFEKR